MNVDESPPVYVIAEAGVNHNGSVEMAKRLVEVAAEAGADAIKFQTFRPDRLVSRWAPKAAYQKKTTPPGESQREMLQRLRLSEEAHLLLRDACCGKGIEFLSTPFDLESLDLLVRTLDLPCLKIGSGELTNGPLLLKAAETGRRIILSTGMATLEEVEQALGVLAFGYGCKGEKPTAQGFVKSFQSDAGQRALKERIILLHCTTEYPAPFEEVHLRAIETLRFAFGLPVGLSDHTQGFAVAIAAAALGVRVIEKHFTLSKRLPGPDHRASLSPRELRAMVRDIRRVEKALGWPEKQPTVSEMGNRMVARKSLVANEPIRKGARFTKANLTCKRPGDGLSPMQYWDLLGKRAKRDFAEDEPVTR